MSSSLPDFFDYFCACFRHVLGIKRKEVCVDRTLKFISLFVNSLQEKEISNETSSAFTNLFLRYLLRGIDAKDKSVRLRCCQLISKCIDGIEELDTNVFDEIREKLLERCNDKEYPVRVQAVLALSKFQSAEDEEIIRCLLLRLGNDSSSEVRKTVLQNIDINENSIPYIVERIRDVDPSIRKHVYQNFFQQVKAFNRFSKEDRERILLWGLNDRDEDVKCACIDTMSSTWIDIECEENILEFLKSLDVTKSSVGEVCLRALYERNKDIDLEFLLQDTFWYNLKPESILLGRVFIQCKKEKGIKSLPPAMTLIKVASSCYLDSSSNPKEENMFIISEILKIFLSSDYASVEIERKQVLDFVQSYLNNPLDGNSNLLFDVLCQFSFDQEELIAFVFEMIQKDLGLQKQDDDPNQELTELDLNAVDILKTAKALSCITLLMERIDFPVDEHSEFCTNLLVNYALPTIKCDEPALQISGLMCLIQFCLMNEELAADNMDFFIDFYYESTDFVQGIAVKAIIDMLHKFGISRFTSNTIDKVNDLFKNLLDGDDFDLKNIVVEGCMKLMIFCNYKNSDLLEKLITMYFTVSKEEELEFETIKQCLAFSFPLYSFSKVENQYFMAKTSLKIFYDLIECCSSTDSEITPQQIVPAILEWIDPENLSESSQRNSEQLVAHVRLYTSLCINLIKSSINMATTSIKAALQIVNRIPLEDKSLFEQLIEDLEELKLSITDRNTGNSLQRLQNYLRERLIEE